jgi:hypothetical protein
MEIDFPDEFDTQQQFIGLLASERENEIRLMAGLARFVMLDRFSPWKHVCCPPTMLTRMKRQRRA